MTDSDTNMHPLELGILWGLRVSGAGFTSLHLSGTRIWHPVNSTAALMTYIRLHQMRKSCTVAVRDYKEKDRWKNRERENEERERAYHRIVVTNFDVNGSDIPFGDFHGLMLLLLNVLVRYSRAHLWQYHLIFYVFTVKRTLTLLSLHMLLQCVVVFVLLT